MKRDQKVRGLGGRGLSKEERAKAVRTAGDVDVENTAWMKGVIAEVGWPTRSMVGKDGALAAFLLVQHADKDPEFQARCLELMQPVVAKGEASKSNFAYLTDRVRVKQGQPQVYGTQYGVEKDAEGRPVRDDAGNVKYLLPLVIDVDRLDDRRREAGLGPWADYEKRMAPRQKREPALRPRAAGEKSR